MKPYLFNILFLIISFWLPAQNVGDLKQQSPVTFHGGISLGATIYGSQNTTERQSPFSWSFSASPILSLYGIQFPFTIIYADNSRNISTPFQRFGVSPYYKWAKLHLGHRNLYFHPFVLSGQPIFGAGFEINPKLLRLGAIYGRLAKAEYIDSTRANFRGQPSVFERKGYCVKLGFGSEANHVDLVWLKAKDDPNSLPVIPPDTRTQPAENAVLGVSAKFSPFKWVVWNFDLAGSAYTRDTRANEVVIPDSFNLIKKITGLFQPRLSSQAYAAGETSLRFLFGNSSVLVALRRVHPDYKSMGTFFFQTDIEQLTFSPSLILFKNKLLLNASAGWQRDNILHQKSFTSHRFIGSANVSWRPSQVFSASVQLSNFGLTQSRFTDLVEDSLQLRLVNQTAGINLQWNLQRNGRLHIISLSSNYQNTNDASPSTGGIGDLTSIFGSLMYTYSVLEKRYNVFGGINGSRNDFAAGGVSSYYGGTLGAGVGFFQNKLNLRGSGSYFLQNNQTTSNGTTITARIGIVWRITNQQSIQLNSNLVNSSNGRQEWFGSVNYGIGF